MGLEQFAKEDEHDELERLRTENSELLNELEDAYLQLNAAIELSKKETTQAYAELRAKITSLERKVFELASLNNVGKALASVLRLESVVDVILEKICSLAKIDVAALYLIDEDGEFTLEGSVGLPAKLSGSSAGLEDKTFLEEIMSEDEPFFLRRTAEDLDHSDFVLDLRTRSLAVIPLSTAEERLGVLAINGFEPDVFDEDQRMLFSTFGTQAAIALANAKLYQNLENVVVGVVLSLTTALEAKDPYTKGHSKRVAEYSVVIGEEMGMDQNQLRELKWAGLVHDIGKIGVDQSILSKDGQLTIREKDEMDLHPLVGEAIIRPIHPLSSTAKGVATHHERFDGEGYPHGLSSEEIPLVGRILAVADAFDAMTSERPYRKGVPLNRARDEIAGMAGTQFDPEVVKIFDRVFPKLTAIRAGVPNVVGPPE
jgi:HD-GYP domain-containing protein (c-di-GMP phosphodiesterase class II)